MTQAKSTRDRLFGASTVRRERITVQDADGAIEVELRELSAARRGDVLNSAVSTDPETDEQVTDQKKLVPAVIIATAFDPATGEPLFTAADHDAIGQMSASFVDQLFKPAARLSALLEDHAEAIKGNSAATAVSDSASPSPANSE